MQGEIRLQAFKRHMKYQFQKKLAVVALGGSIVYPEEIDTRFLRNFKKCVEQFVAKGWKFVLVVGGGRPARVYQAAAAEVVALTDADKDWIGIHATRMNAELLRAVFGKMADPVVIERRGQIKKLARPVTIGAGWQPGWSTDYDAIALAKDFGASSAVIMGKPDYVYDKDPSLFKNAKQFPELTWKMYRKIVPKKWTPGFHAPVDPIAARLGEEEGMPTIVIGKDLKNFEALLRGKEFKGTLLS